MFPVSGYLFLETSRIRRKMSESSQGGDAVRVIDHQVIVLRAQFCRFVQFCTEIIGKPLVGRPSDHKLSFLDSKNRIPSPYQFAGIATLFWRTPIIEKPCKIGTQQENIACYCLNFNLEEKLGKLTQVDKIQNPMNSIKNIIK